MKTIFVKLGYAFLTLLISSAVFSCKNVNTAVKNYSDIDVSVPQAGAGSTAEIDEHLAGLLQHLDHWHTYSSDNTSINPEDSVADVDTKLTEYLKDVSLKYPQTITGRYPKATKIGLSAIASDDNKICLYSWDTYLGGSMRNYSDYIQYAGTNGMYVKCMNCNDTEQGDYGTDYNSIIAIHTTTNKTLYFITGMAVISTKDRAESISAYEIEGDLLKPASVFKTTTKTLNSIDYGYDSFASNVDPLPHIHFGNDNKRLYIPIVSGEQITAHYLVYVFDGNDFIFDKNVH